MTSQRITWSGASKLTAGSLIDAGYAPFHDPYNAAVLGQAYRGSWQLRFVDPVGTRYVLAVHHGTRPAGHDWRPGDFFIPEVQLTLGGARFNVELLVQPWQTVEDVEGFVQDLWRTMQLDYREGPGGEPCFPQQVRH